jgi:hypothetical protein
MSSVIDRVRAADPVTPDEFAGLADFDSLVLEPRKRGRKRWLSLPAVGALVAALIVLPTSAPQASEVLRRATEAMAVPADSILYAKSHAVNTQVGKGGDDYGVRQVWVYGDKRMRWLDGRNDDVYIEGEGTTSIRDGKTLRSPEVKMVPNEVFRSGALLEAAKKADGVELTEDGDAYVLRWREPSGPPHEPAIEMTMWINKDTYAPEKFTDHSWGKDVEGKDFDQTYTETVLDFKALPATPENLKRLDQPSQ